MEDISRDYGKYPTFIPLMRADAGHDRSMDYGRYPTFAPVGHKCRKRGKPGVLRLDEMANLSESHEAAVFGSGYRRRQIKSITFVDTLADMPRDAWDVSKEGNGSVRAWVKPNGDLYDLYIGGWGGVCTGASCKHMFAGYKNAERITFGGVLDTSAAQDMFGMFALCKSLTELNLRGFNTSNVGDMHGMFTLCESLTELDVSSFDTAKVQDMSGMFEGCKSLTRLDLSGFNTSSVQDMDSMFSKCGSLTELNLSGFDTSGVKRMTWMYSECISLTRLDLSGFDTSGVKDMRWMFILCESLTDLKLPEHFVPDGADTTDMFKYCPAQERKEKKRISAGVLQADEAPSFGKTEEYPVFGSKYLRRQIGSVTFLDTLKDKPKDAWDVSQDADGSVMAWVKPSGYGYDLYIGGWGKIRTGKSCKGMFAGYSRTTKFTFGGALDTSATESMRRMFADCRSLRNLDLSSLCTSNVRGMGEMFQACFELTSLNLKGLDTSKVEDMSWMFSDCLRLNGLDISGFRTYSVQTMDGMFSGCRSLTDLSRPYSFFVPDGADAKDMYRDCPAGKGQKRSLLSKLFK